MMLRNGNKSFLSDSVLPIVRLYKGKGEEHEGRL